MYSVCFETLSSFVGINKSGYLEETPFGDIGGVIIIDYDWWMTLSQYHQNIIIDLFNDCYKVWNFNFSKEVIDSKLPCSFSKTTALFQKFYDSYISSYDINYWYSCIDYSLVLTKTSSISIPVVRKKLEQYIHTNKPIYFRISNSRKPYKPIFNLKELEIEIQKEHKEKINKNYDHELFLTPWRCDINSKYQFLVFVKEKRIRGICQKKCYRYLDLFRDEVNRIVEKIVEYYRKYFCRIIYNSFVFDIFVNDNTIYLVNIYPGESWGPYGSSLFDWKEFDNNSKDKAEIVVRYIDHDSPVLAPRIENLDMSGLSIKEDPR